MNNIPIEVIKRVDGYIGKNKGRFWICGNITCKICGYDEYLIDPVLPHEVESAIKEPANCGRCGRCASFHVYDPDVFLEAPRDIMLDLFSRDQADSMQGMYGDGI